MRSLPFKVIRATLPAGEASHLFSFVSDRHSGTTRHDLRDTSTMAEAENLFDSPRRIGSCRRHQTKTTANRHQARFQAESPSPPRSPRQCLPSSPTAASLTTRTQRREKES